MAGLYITFGNPQTERLNAAAGHMRFGDEVECRFESELSYVWLSHDSEKRFSPAVDPHTGLHCVVGGRLCWPESIWREAEQLPYTGGLVNRVLLDRFIKGGPEAVTPFNGAATVVVWEPRARVAHVWTDQFGYHPAFIFGETNSMPAVLTTFPDVITKDPALDVLPDHVSMAEFLRAWRVTPPNTYYKNLKHVGAAIYQCIDLGTETTRKREYWRPFQGEFFQDISEASDALEQALLEAIGERTAISERSALFISGGADSRVMLYASSSQPKIWGINLYERPTSEAAIAETLCNRAGVTYIGHGRDNDYYPRMHAENVRWSGAMWSAEDNHYLGVSDVIRELNPDLVMTACTTDWVFKGYGLEKTYRRILGKNIPIAKFVGSRVLGFLPNPPLAAPTKYADEINARIETWFQGTPRSPKSDLDYLLLEDKRVRPTCYTVSVSGQIMYRTYPFDTFLADSRIADCYSRMPAKWKLNGEVWGLAASKLCKNANDVIDSNYGWALDASTSSKLISFAKGWLRRKIDRQNTEDVTDGHPPSNASWPDFGWYANHSDTLKDFWERTPTSDRELMSELWGEDPWLSPLSDWSRKPHEMMRILTLLQHWRNQRQ